MYNGTFSYSFSSNPECFDAISSTMEASADPRITTHPEILRTDTAVYSGLRACTDSSTVYSALPHHPSPGLGVYDPSQLYDGQWPQDGYTQQPSDEPNAVSNMASFTPQETYSSMPDEFLVWQEAPFSVGPRYPAMRYLNPTVSDIPPALELRGYTTFPRTINSLPNSLVPGLDPFDINGPCDERLSHPEPISEHHSVPDHFTQSPNLDPSFNPQEPQPCPSPYGEFPARQDASLLIEPCCPPAEYHSPPPTTFANLDLVNPRRQITASIATQSVHNWHPEPIHNGTTSQMPAHNAEYESDLRRRKDPRYLKVLEITIGTMAQVEVPMDGLILPETRKQIDQGIGSLVQYLKGELLLSSTDAELQSWLQCVLDKFPRWVPVGTLAQIDKALGRRQYKRDRLYICFCCKNTLTTLNGLGNHVRSHLKFYMSFCHHPGCNFRSVTPTLPKRHLDSKHGLKLVPGRGKPHNNGTSLYL